MIHTREATVSRQRCGKRSPETEARWGRIVWAGGARPAALSPARKARLDCPYKYGNCLCALRSVGDAVCPSAA